jgi:DNA-binding NtrC family response regulator
MKNGAVDFVLKPWKNQKLLGTILSAQQLRYSKKEIEKLKVTQEKLSDTLEQPYIDFIGESPSIERVREVVDRVSSTDANVLILGENGTGKEVVARALHRKSTRQQQRFYQCRFGFNIGITFRERAFWTRKRSLHRCKAGQARTF